MEGIQLAVGVAESLLAKAICQLPGEWAMNLPCGMISSWNRGLNEEEGYSGAAVGYTGLIT